VPNTEVLVERISKAIARSFELNDLPGLAVGVRFINGGDVIDITRLTGYADNDKREPLNEGAVFHCASISKLFVATAVMRLFEDGKLDPCDKLCERLNWFKPADARYCDVTIGQLLSHIAGVADVSDYHWRENEKGDGSLKRYIMSEEVSGMRLLWPPGSPDAKGPLPKFSYTNIGYELLGAVIAEVSGKTFEEYIKESIFVKLGMADSTFLTFLRPDVRMAMPHEKDAGRNIRRLDYYPYTRPHAPSSTLTSTVSDLKKFGDAFLSCDPALLSKASYDQMWKRVVAVPARGAYGAAMGIGWFIREWDGIKLYGHDGSDEGFRSSFWLCPELGLQLIALANITEANLKDICRSIFDIIKSEHNY